MQYVLLTLDSPKVFYAGYQRSNPTISKDRILNNETIEAIGSVRNVDNPKICKDVISM